MRQDLDALMEARGLDALLLFGPAQHNPAVAYFTGAAHLTSVLLVKPRGREPLLFYNAMERDEAAQTGLPSRSLSDFPWRVFLRQAQGDEARARALRYQAVLKAAGIEAGRLGVTGRLDFGPPFDALRLLPTLMPGLTLEGLPAHQTLLAARRTKSAEEVERIRRMGQVTTEVVGRVADFLTSQRGKDGLLVKSDGQPVTIGEVKRRINLWLAELGAENPEGTIFAQGHDAGVPHSAGRDDEALELGTMIVFDIFPCEAGGGYFYDFTRTWCLGYATDEAQALYEDVLAVYRQIMSELAPNGLCRDLQRRTCELFAAQGHPTSCHDPATQQGYVHSLGHGLGLDVHEAPWFGAHESNTDRLEPGVVVTIEPGLYYPERGLGCRIEDTVWARSDGRFEVLADFPYDLVLPVKG